MTSETMLRTWFKKAIQPSDTMLWVSAVAPDTFQGDPRILEELLKRPLEFPDAMGQQRATARYSACLIAKAINETKPKPSELIAFLDEFNFFQNPDILLHKPVPKKLLSQIHKLTQEAFDPSTFWRYELRTLTKHFQEGLHVLRTLFKTKWNSKPTPSLTSFFVSEHEWWGTTYHREANMVNVQPPFLFLPAVSKGLVLRDAVRVFLPTSFQDAMDVQEFANILVTKLLGQTEGQLWSEIRWNGTQPTPEQNQWVSTISTITPTLIEEKRLPSIYKRLKRIDSLVSRVPTGSFTIMTQQELGRIEQVPTITKIQQQILLTLAKNPMTSERQLAKITQLARGTINRNLLTLEDQFGIQVAGEVNYNKLGLTPLFLMAQAAIKEPLRHALVANLHQQLSTFPYCFRLNVPVSLTSTTLFSLLALPDNAIPKFLHNLEQWEQDTGVSTRLFRVNRFEWGLGFTYWEKFSPVEWKILASSVLRSEDSKFSSINSIRYETDSVKLTREALRVLLILQNNMRISQRQLAETAQTSITTAANHYNRFIPDVVTPYLGFTNPPLPESVIVLVECFSTESCKHLIAGLRLLPAYQVWQLATKQDEKPTKFLLTVNLPLGALVPFSTVFQEVINFHDSVQITPLIISEKLPQIHELPLALFKTVGQEWICSSMLLESLFSSATQ